MVRHPTFTPPKVHVPSSPTRRPAPTSRISDSGSFPSALPLLLALVLRLKSMGMPPVPSTAASASRRGSVGMLELICCGCCRPE